MADNRNKRIEEKYEKVFSQLGEIQTIFPATAKFEMAQMIEQAARSSENIKNIVSTNQEIGVKAGFVAEEFHVETFNLDAIYKGKDIRAITENYPEWNKFDLKKNDSVADIALIKNGKLIHKSQSKYWSDSRQTANEMGRMKDGHHQYNEADSFIGPSDQVNPTDGAESIAEKSHRTFLKNKDTRPGVANAARNVEEKVADRLKDEAASKPLGKKGAEKIAKNPDSKIRKKVHDQYQRASTAKQMKQAAVGAVTISAVMSGAFNTVTYCKMVREGKMSESEAVVKIIGETASSAADSALKASANVGIQSLTVRYGSREVTEQIAKNSFKNLVKTNAVTVGVICGIDMIRDLVRLAAGKMDKQEFETRNGRNVLNTSAGVMGAGVGCNVATSIPMAGAGFIGGIAGGLIAGLAMQFAIENHIEKPYQELISNTVALTQSMQIFQQVSENIFKGQVVFGAFLEEERKLNAKFENQSKRISMAGDKMKNAIDKL
ncbi:hypothetical protein QUF72_02705 [Desulfobacterales bacterium HSG2]|nr:hypothetical protein [Desulfobacterales bacterium HSG2]